MASTAEDGLHCVVAGGSLVGLSAAIALSRLGMVVTVLERSPARAAEGGGGLGVDVALLQQVTGLRADPPVLHGVDRDTTGWHLLQGWLEDQATRRRGVTVHRGTEVTGVHPGNGQQPASVMTADGGEYHADLVIGADGARSTVRAAVDPAGRPARRDQRAGHRRLPGPRGGGAALMTVTAGLQRGPGSSSPHHRSASSASAPGKENHDARRDTQSRANMAATTRFRAVRR
jgi:2-polyprenyl-6-methoxyphenol hydroxylase-like FAD-dependent oxidoreductase